MDTLTVYYSPSCAFSAGTIAFLMLRGADVRLVNLDQHADARPRLEKRLDGKKLETPLLEASDGLHVAPPLSELKDLLETWNLPDEAAPREQIKHGSDESASVTRMPADS